MFFAKDHERFVFLFIHCRTKLLSKYYLQSFKKNSKTKPTVQTVRVLKTAYLQDFKKIIQINSNVQSDDRTWSCKNPYRFAACFHRLKRCKLFYVIFVMNMFSCLFSKTYDMPDTSSLNAKSKSMFLVQINFDPLQYINSCQHYFQISNLFFKLIRTWSFIVN